MAAGDILSVTIPDSVTAGLVTDGWYCDVVIEGFVDGGTYDFGFGAHNDPTNAKFKMTVVSEGYNSSGTLTTVTRYVYGTRALRKPYPNDSQLQETESGGNLTIRVALSEFVYNDDKNGGAGTSGTNPTVTIAAGWYTDNGTGGSGSPSNVATDLAVTNNSTLDYPKVLARWDAYQNTMVADRVTEAFTLGVTAFHKFKIACVRFDADGRTSTHNENQTITTKSADVYPVTELGREFYQTSAIPLTNFTDDELIDLRFRAYPVVGDADAVLDTNDYTSPTTEIMGFNKITIVCNKNNDGDLYAVIDTGGNDVAGVVSATLAIAEATPYATIGAAVADGANVIYLNNGTHPLSHDITRVVTDQWVRVMPHPTNSSKAGAIGQMVSTPTRDYRCQRYSLEGLTIRKANTSSYLDGDGLNFIRFRDCTFHENGVGPTLTGPGHNSYGIYYQNLDGDFGDAEWSIDKFPGARVASSYEGCMISGGTLSATFGMIGCKVTNCAIANSNNANLAPKMDGIIFANNIMRSNGVRIAFSYAEEHEDVYTGLVFANNVLETVNSFPQPAIELFSNSGSHANNFIFHHNIIVGQRGSIAYNSVGEDNAPKINWSQIGNMLESWNNKDDTFVDTPDGRRNGCWPVGYNVGSYYNLMSGYLSNDFSGEFMGLNVRYADLPNNGNDWVTYFKDYQAGLLAGNGDYTIVEGTLPEDFVPSDYIYYSYDISGLARDTDFTSSGPYRGNGEGAASGPCYAIYTGNNPYILMKAIKWEPNTGYLATGYRCQITTILSSGNVADQKILRDHIGREYFRRLFYADLQSYITDPYDAGMRPKTITGLYA